VKYLRVIQRKFHFSRIGGNDTPDFIFLILNILSVTNNIQQVEVPHYGQN